MPSTPTQRGRAAPYNITIEQGATYDYTMTFRQSPTVKRAIAAITRANPGSVRCNGLHGFVTGDVVFVSKLKGMPQADNRAYTITAILASSFTLGIDTSSYDAYVSGGIVDNGKPINLTGYTARIQVREKITDTSAVLTLTTENGGITLGGTAGTIRTLATATQTAALAIAAGFYDLELIDASGAVRRLLSGTVTISKEVTR